MSKKGQEAGFTLIDILVAIAMFAVIFPALVNMFVSVGSINKESSDSMIVSDIALEKIENLRSQGFDTLTDGTTDFSNELPDVLSQPRSGNYTISTKDNNVKKVVVSISYTRQGQSVPFNYTVYIAKNGLGQK